jgi:general secretion pathway protein G
VIQQLNKKRADEGFTLIELLIVIIILGILAAIVVFAVGGTRKDSVAASCKTDAKSIELSLEAQNTKNGNFPASKAEAIDSTKGALLKSWPGGSVATDDYMFTYTQTGTGTGYTVAIGGAKVDGATWDNTSSANIAVGCKGK